MKSVTEMVSLLFYLVVVVLIIFSSLAVFILGVVKVVQVSNGFSLLDPDVSDGLKMRKWFISGVAIANGLRCFSSATELVIFSIMVVKEDLPPSSISYYGGGFENIIPYVLLVCRVLPTLLFLAYYAYLALYFAGLSYSLRGGEFTTVKMAWTAANAVLSLVLLQFLFVQTKPFALNIVCFVAVCLYAWLIGWYSKTLQQFFVHNQEVMAGAPSNPRKVFARLQYLSSIALSALLLYAVVYAIDISRVFHDRSYYWQSSVDLIAVLYSEVVCAWLMVSLMSNTLVPVEARLSGAGTGPSTSTTATTIASAAHGGVSSAIAMTAIGSAVSVTAGGASTGRPAVTPRSIAQQQQLQRFGNYGAIATDDAGLP